jgi:hypothetical protein
MYRRISTKISVDRGFKRNAPVEKLVLLESTHFSPAQQTLYFYAVYQVVPEQMASFQSIFLNNVPALSTARQLVPNMMNMLRVLHRAV